MKQVLFPRKQHSIGTKLALFTNFLLCLSTPIRAIHKLMKAFGLHTCAWSVWDGAPNPLRHKPYFQKYSELFSFYSLTFLLPVLDSRVPEDLLEYKGCPAQPVLSSSPFLLHHFLRKCLPFWKAEIITCPFSFLFILFIFFSVFSLFLQFDIFIYNSPFKYFFSFPFLKTWAITNVINSDIQRNISPFVELMCQVSWQVKFHYIAISLLNAGFLNWHES